MTTIGKALCVVAMAFMAACSSGPVRLTDEVDSSQLDRSRGEILEGSSSGFHLLVLFPIAINGRYERALADLKEKAGDRVLTDFKVEEYWRYAVVGTVYGTKITATAYPRLAAPPASK